MTDYMLGLVRVKGGVSDFAKSPSLIYLLAKSLVLLFS